MMLGKLDPIKESDLDLNAVAKNSVLQQQSAEKMASELMQIKWILVALALIIILKKS